MSALFPIVDALPCGVFVVNSKYELLSWNKHLESWTDRRLEPDQRPDAREWLPSLAQPDVQQWMQRAFLGGARQPMSSLLTMREGARVPYNQQTSVGALPDPEGSGFLAVVCIQDRGGREPVGEAPRGIAKEMAGADPPARDNHARTDFLAVLSDEVRTPLNAILGMADMLAESTLDSGQRKYAEILQRSGHNLLTLITDILDLARIESGRFELARTTFNLNETVRQCFALIEPRATAQGVELGIEWSKELKTEVLGDPTRLQQVILNLLANTLKVTERGQITLSVAPADQEPGGLIQFCVSGTGTVIPLRNFGRMFGDYAHLDSSTTGKFTGAGLDLGVCQRLVEKMGGLLTISSELGRGMTCKFTAKLGLPHQREMRNVKVEDFHGQTALIVDADATSRIILREALTSWGIQASECTSAEAAIVELDRYKSEFAPYSLAIVNAQLPDCGGFDMALRLREIVPNLPIVMLSSETNPRHAARCRATGINSYAVRPVDRDALLRLVCEAWHFTAPASAPAAGQSLVRVLAAEDSQDNRTLLQAYLSGTRYDVTFVEDGRKAVKAYLDGDFDLILMDVQMPVMNGLEATQAIRTAQKQGHGRKIPIIALTSRTLARDRAAIEAAGCDEHLAKPISKARLIASLDRHVGGRIEIPTADEGSVRIRVPEGLEEVVPGYLESCKQETAHLRSLLKNGDFESIRVIGHQLKGSGGGYGFPILTSLGARIEDAAEIRDAGRLQSDISNMSDYLNRVQLSPASPSV